MPHDCGMALIDMSDITLRDYILAATGVVVIASLVTSLYLLIARLRFRMYLVPAVLLLLHSAALFIVLAGHNFLGWTVASYFLNDWIAVVLLHVYLTFAVYIIWMPLLRR